jgi:ketosteroid isomerase-like protein
MDVVVHHTTVAGDFALCRSQWRITGTDPSGKAIDLHQAMEAMRRLDNGEWVFFIDHPWGADASWAVDQPPRTD